MINCHLDGRKNANGYNEGLIFDGGDTQDPTVGPDPSLLDSMTITNCYFQVVQVGASCTGAIPEGSRGLKIRNFGYNQISNTSIRLVDSTTCAGTPGTTGVPAIILHIRDKVIKNIFNTDSILASGNWAQGRYDLTTSANNPPTPDPSNNIYLNCLFKNTSKSGTNPYGHAIRWDVADDSTTYERCSFVAGPQAGNIILGPMTGNTILGMVFDHCAFYADSLPNGAARLFSDGPISVTNSIFYAPRHTNTTTARALEFGTGLGTNYTGNWNAYFTPANRANSIYRSSAYYAPGAVPFVAFGDDSNSIYCSPRWTDSTLANFNPTPIGGASTIGAGEGGSTIGPNETTPDVTAPTAINDLIAMGGNGSAELNWTPTGDDALAGVAAAYDVRYSTSPITAGTFDFNARVTTGVPIPIARNGTQRQTMTVSGLGSNRFFYFAIKVLDEVPNTSAISNSPAAVTQGGGGGTGFFPPD